MSYLYGDSSPSDLQTDFIAFLRDALDFSVQVLGADQRIQDGIGRGLDLQGVSYAEVERLEALGSTVARAVEAAPIGDGQSATSRCAESIVRSTVELVRSETERARGHLAAELARIDADATRERESCLAALERLLLKHDLPQMGCDIRLKLEDGGGRYAAWLHLKGSFGLEARIELEVPAGHALAHALRLDKLVERLEVQAPEAGGWLRKETKLRPQRLDKDYITELFVGVTHNIIRLRAAPDGTGAGFDLALQAEAPRVSLLRVGEGEKFDLADADADKIVALQDKLIESCAALVWCRKKLLEATLDGSPLTEHKEPRLLVERLVGLIAPVVQEIARRSLSPNELVLKRQTGDGRREEIFVSRAELQQKLELLPPQARALFAPLGLADKLALPVAAPATTAAPPRPKRTTPTPAPAVATAAARTPAEDLVVFDAPDPGPVAEPVRERRVTPAPRPPIKADSSAVHALDQALDQVKKA